MPPSCLGVQDELHLGSVVTKIRVALKRSYSERERDQMMGSPQPSYGQVKGKCMSTRDWLAAVAGDPSQEGKNIILPTVRVQILGAVTSSITSLVHIFMYLNRPLEFGPHHQLNNILAIM